MPLLHPLRLPTGLNLVSQSQSLQAAGSRGNRPLPILLRGITPVQIAQLASPEDMTSIVTLEFTWPSSLTAVPIVKRRSVVKMH